MHYVGKENQQKISGSADYCFAGQFQSGSATKRNYNNFNQNIIISNSQSKHNKRSNSEDDDQEEEDEEQFQVFSLAAIGEQQFQRILATGPPVPATGARSGKCSSSKVADRRPQIEGRDVEAHPDPDADQDSEELYELVDEEVLSSCMLHYKQRQDAAHNKLPQSGSFYADCSTGSCSTNTTTTLKSTGGHSSGFLSAEESFGQVKARRHHRNSGGGGGNNCNRQHEGKRRLQLHEKQRCDRLSARSKVIDDLDRLMADVERCSNSPADSCLSCCDSAPISMPLKDDTKLANELDYSTLCRDEFSSFISVNGVPVRGDFRPSHPHKELHLYEEPLVLRGETRSGPTLIGVHDTNNAAPALSSSSGSSSSRAPFIERQHVFTNSSRDSSSPMRSDLSESQHEFRSSPSTSSELSTGTSSNSASDHHRRQESLICASEGEFVLTEQRREDDRLSEMLDTYLHRVRCLLRLTSGDQSVSLEEAFGGETLGVSEENCTSIEFAPLERAPNSTKVVQEMVIAEEDSDDGETMSSADNQRCQVVVKSIGSHQYKTLLSSVQTSAKFNWVPLPNHPSTDDERLDESSKTHSIEEKENLVDKRRLLEESLVKNLMKISSSETNSFATGRDRAKFIETVRVQVNEFIEHYDNYQRELKRQTSFASDWHQNWLFASKRAQTRESHFKHDYEDQNNGLSGPKRARMSGLAENYSNLVNKGDAEQEQPIDMLKYSTLILSRWKPVKLTYLTSSSSDQSFDDVIEHFYEAQPDQFSELQSQAMDSSDKTDITRLLLCDLYGDLEPAGDSQRSKSLTNSRSLLIDYDTSSMRPLAANQLSFSAYGYRFSTPIVRLANRCDSLKVARLRETILSRLERLLSCRHRSSTGGGHCDEDNGMSRLTARGDQARFSIKVANAELINKLPVIQFCAKVSGAHPISVRWFKADKEISSLEALRNSGSQPRGLRVRDELGGRGHMKRPGAHWPMQMCANYDFEYQNEGSSWYRFRRRQDEVLFEIRDANLQEDYEQTYKCVITNYCSTEECSFSLKRRQSGENERKQPLPVEPREPRESRRTDGHALLRTWSQRTLHKPVPTEPPATVGGEPGNQPSEGSWTQQSIGRRSVALKAASLSEQAEEDKFGKNFPYHPENLLKRLQENKFSTLLRSRRPPDRPDQDSAGNHDKMASGLRCLATDSPTNDSFADSFEPLMEEISGAGKTTTTTLSTTDCRSPEQPTTSAVAKEPTGSFQVRRI